MSVEDSRSNSSSNNDDDNIVKVMNINPNKIKQWTVKTDDDNDMSLLQEIEGEDK